MSFSSPHIILRSPENILHKAADFLAELLARTGGALAARSFELSTEEASKYQQTWDNAVLAPKKGIKRVGFTKGLETIGDLRVTFSYSVSFSFYHGSRFEQFKFALKTVNPVNSRM